MVKIEIFSSKFLNLWLPKHLTMNPQKMELGEIFLGGTKISGDPHLCFQNSILTHFDLKFKWFEHSFGEYIVCPKFVGDQSVRPIHSQAGDFLPFLTETPLFSLDLELEFWGS